MTQQAHPYYREGFDDAIDGHPLQIDAAPAYVESWIAACECKALLEALSNPAVAHAIDVGATRREYERWKSGTRQ